MERRFHSQTNLKDKGIILSSNGSTKQSSTRSRHRYMMEVGHQLQAASAFAWGKSYQYFWWGNKSSRWQFRSYYVHHHCHHHNHNIITHFTFLTSSWFLSCQSFPSSTQVSSAGRSVFVYYLGNACLVHY